MGTTSGNRLEYVYMAGMAHSGSTLVSFLLNAHPEIVSIGEAELVDQNLAERLETGQGQCSCRRSFSDCPFWGRVVSGMAARGQGFGPPPFYSLVRRRASEARLNAFTETVLAESGKRIFLDASKQPAHIFALQMNRRLDLRVLNLIRDGEGIVSSWRKRRPRASYRRLTSDWILREIRRGLFVRLIAPARVLNVRYEDLIAQPEQGLNRIFRFLGVDEGVQVVSNYKSNVDHHIIGNQMRLDRSEGIRFDPDWRSRLDPELRAAFRQAGGPILNRRLGYEGAE